MVSPWKKPYKMTKIYNERRSGSWAATRRVIDVFVREGSDGFLVVHILLFFELDLEKSNCLHPISITTPDKSAFETVK